MTQAYRLDCAAAAVDCRFIIQSENEGEAVESAKIHMRDVHREDYTDGDLRSNLLKIV